MTLHAPPAACPTDLQGSRANCAGDAASGNGPPPEAAAALYVGKIMHQRMKPAGHRFTYSVFNLMIDLDRLGEADRLSRLFSVNRPNVAAFYEKDHIDGDHPSLRAYVDALLARGGIVTPAARILLVCYPRILGRVFNPIAVYYAYDDAGDPVALIYEVRNTFGERHSYVCAVEPGDVSPAGIRQERNKLFYVSPFIAMDMRYRFRMTPPGRAIRWRILETDAEGPLLTATFSGKQHGLTTATMAKYLLRIPLQTFKIVGGIHYEALRLWLKGVHHVPRPKPPQPASFHDERPAHSRKRHEEAMTKSGQNRLERRTS